MVLRLVVCSIWNNHQQQKQMRTTKSRINERIKERTMTTTVRWCHGQREAELWQGEDRRRRKDRSIYIARNSVGMCLGNWLGFQLRIGLVTLLGQWRPVNDIVTAAAVEWMWLVGCFSASSQFRTQLGRVSRAAAAAVQRIIVIKRSKMWVELNANSIIIELVLIMWKSWRLIFEEIKGFKFKRFHILLIQNN